jgi:hypothetical protein
MLFPVTVTFTVFVHTIGGQSGVAVAIAVELGVLVAVSVGLGVLVAVSVAVWLGVNVRVGVTLGVGVRVGFLLLGTIFPLPPPALLAFFALATCTEAPATAIKATTKANTRYLLTVYLEVAISRALAYPERPSRRVGPQPELTHTCPVATPPGPSCYHS